MVHSLPSQPTKAQRAEPHRATRRLLGLSVALAGCVLLTVVDVFGFGRESAAAVVVVNAPVAEPVDPFQGGEL